MEGLVGLSIAAVSIFSGMGSYSSQLWSLDERTGLGTGFSSIGVVCCVEG